MRSSTRSLPKGHTKIPEYTKKGRKRSKNLHRRTFWEILPKLKAAFKTNFGTGYRQLYLTEMLKDVDMGIYLLPKCKNYTYN